MSRSRQFGDELGPVPVELGEKRLAYALALFAGESFARAAWIVHGHPA